jgi:alanine dehydrogenase
LSGVPGVAPAKVLIIGGGTVGDNAARIAQGLGADVTLLDKSVERLRDLDRDYEGSIKCVHSEAETLETYALEADLIIGAVLVPGAAAPKLLTRDIVRRMQPGSVLVDVAIDQGGCFATSHPTTYDDPTFVVDGVVHYCVANMPGAVPRTSAFALNNATLPYIAAVADLGFKEAMRQDAGLATGLNVHAGRLTHPAVARDLEQTLWPVDDVLAQ